MFFHVWYTINIPISTPSGLELPLIPKTICFTKKNKFLWSISVPSSYTQQPMVVDNMELNHKNSQ